MDLASNTNRGRPPKELHECEACGHQYKNAQSLASHKRDAKKGKVKCAIASHVCEG